MPSKLQLLPSDIVERLRELPDRVASVEGLAALWLFGSFARGEATPISDVDLAFLPDAGLTGEALDRFETRFYRAIAHTLHTDEFTFVNLRCVAAYIAWRVLVEGELLLCRDEQLAAELAEVVYRYAPEVRQWHHAGNVDFLEGFGMPDPTIDKERVIEFLRLISEDLRDLSEKAQVSKESYARSRDIQAVMERRLQTAIESCLNIGNHLIARLGLRAPQDYADVFHILREGRILPAEAAEQMADMARFRNLLVHVYWTIDSEQIYDSLPTRLSVLETFAQHITQWLEALPSSRRH